MKENTHCINCERTLIRKRGVPVCPVCNSSELDIVDLFEDDTPERDHLFIKCPGATLYKDGTNDVLAGVRFLDNSGDKPEFEIVDHPVYAPTHKRRRRIKREALGKVRRCRGCQDYTVRMRRKEGADFYIPSSRQPRRKKLRSVEYVSYEP
ncbi:MAG: hypothetical protein ACE5FH_05685 [Candidatus Zixiibacteriota bacterium]